MCTWRLIGVERHPITASGVVPTDAAEPGDDKSRAGGARGVSRSVAKAKGMQLWKTRTWRLTGA
jgi:hypothetical protein